MVRALDEGPCRFGELAELLPANAPNVPRHATCGSPLEGRPSCPLCERVVDPTQPNDDTVHHPSRSGTFADDAGNPNREVPTTTIGLTPHAQPDGRTRMPSRPFSWLEDIEQILVVGAKKGMRSAIAQIDELFRVEVIPQ